MWWNDLENSLKLSNFVSGCENDTRSNERGTSLMLMMLKFKMGMIIFMASDGQSIKTWKTMISSSSSCCWPP